LIVGHFSIVIDFGNIQNLPLDSEYPMLGH